MSLLNVPSRFASPRPRRVTSLLLSLAAVGVAAAVVHTQVRKAERENPPRGQFLEIDGVRLHYMERGEGPPILLFHGNGTMAQDFELSGLLDALARTHRVIAFDRPGYGWSSRPRSKIWGPIAQAHLLHKAMEKLGISSATVLGHSWGTLVALALALEYPASIDRLVLLSGYYFPTLRLDVPLFSPPAIPIIGDLMRYTVSPLVGRLIWKRLVKTMFRPAPISKRFRAFPTWMALRPSQLRAGAAESALMIPSVMALKRRYHDLSMPITLVAGTGDRVASAKHQSRRLHEQLPGSRLHLIDGIGHMVHHSALSEVVSAIESPADIDPTLKIPTIGAHSKDSRANTPVG